MRISEIVARMEAYHVNFDSSRPTCDGVIAGDAEKECTGVVVTCAPTAAVIKKAAAMGCNFIIAHEPLYFVGDDKTDHVEENSVRDAKEALVESTCMVIYRNHDHLHSDTPDGIFSGVTKLLGWEKYLRNSSYMPGCVYDLPKTTVREIVAQLARTMHISGIRIIGDPDMEVETAGVTFHFLGTPMDKTALDFVEKNGLQVIITGETVDWTVGEYVQDALALGKKRALIMPGHFNWEEPGMEHFANVIRELIDDAVPVSFVQSGSGFKWLEF